MSVVEPAKCNFAGFLFFILNDIFQVFLEVLKSSRMKSLRWRCSTLKFFFISHHILALMSSNRVRRNQTLWLPMGVDVPNSMLYGLGLVKILTKESNIKEVWSEESEVR